jgi:hypothetical protein
MFRSSVVLFAVRVACLIACVCIAPEIGLAQSIAADIRQSWEQDYQRIAQELVQYRRDATADTKTPGRLPILDEQARILPGDRDVLDVQLRRLEALLNHLPSMPAAPDLSEERAALERLKLHSTQAEPGDESARRRLFMESRSLARTVALKNPLLDFDAVIFNTFQHQIEKNNIMNHDQDVGYSAAPGGGVGVVTGWRTGRPTGRNLLHGVTIDNGPYQGLEISAAGGSFNSFDLSFDGRQIVFAWSRRGPNPWQTWTPFESEFWIEDNTFHLFVFRIGSTTCRQLTFGNRSDHSPCWLPDGRIAFMSERRNTTARCAASRHQPTSAMYSVRPDGSDLIQLSWHDTEEWDPSVNNDGMIVYTRWDYLDRDFHIAHHFWLCYPDGRDPRGPHGNYPLPHTTLEGSRWEDGRALRPWGEYNIRAVPDSTRYIAIAGGHHHTGVYGAPILLDLSVPDDSRTAQVRRITPGNRWINEAGPPNTAGGKTRLPGGNVSDQCRDDAHYGYPWPLSEDFYLVTEGSGNCDRIFLLDRFGNRDVIYSGFPIPGVSGLRVVSPRPFRPRRRPPIIPAGTWQGERQSAEAPTATISVMNVYESDFPWPADTKITALRIIQHVPKPWTSPVSNQPRMGYAQSPTGRVILGTVPVEADGSAYFEAPVGKLIYFQALDQEGLAVQSMRSGTYVHPGEQLACAGCHENKWRATRVPAVPLALGRPPSRLQPEVGGVEPINFHRLVRPVLDEKCQPCHRQRNQQPDFSYDSLEPYAFYLHADGGSNHLSWLHGGSRSIAGKFGARWSPLYREGYLSPSHYDIQLTAQERRRITLWLDANSLEMPSFSLDSQVQARARRGELVWPVLDVDPQPPLP